MPNTAPTSVHGQMQAYVMPKNKQTTQHPLHLQKAPSPYSAAKGYTFDSENNSIIKKFERMRYDRVMARLSGMETRSILLYGTTKVCLIRTQKKEMGEKKTSAVGLDVDKSTHLSDHFGLLVCLIPVEEDRTRGGNSSLSTAENMVGDERENSKA
uniref:Uncharacterized protein n=1 Tax=Lotharella globosa TaxID=91324 RepID=A0A7S3YZB8_9EUKA